MRRDFKLDPPDRIKGQILGWCKSQQLYWLWYSYADLHQWQLILRRFHISLTLARVKWPFILRLLLYETDTDDAAVS